MTSDLRKWGHGWGHGFERLARRLVFAPHDIANLRHGCGQHAFYPPGDGINRSRILANGIESAGLAPTGDIGNAVFGHIEAD